MELKFNVILSSVITLSLAVVTSLALNKYMVRNAKLEVTHDMNKILLEEIQNTNQKIENMQQNVKNLREKVEKMKDKISKEDSESLKNLLAVQSQEIHDAFSNISEQLQNLKNKNTTNNENENKDKEPSKDVNKSTTDTSKQHKFLGLF